MFKAFLFFVFAISGCPCLAQVIGAASASAPASFDCVKARSRIEKRICADATLSALDRRVAELFALAHSHTADQRSMKRAQRRWLDERDDCDDASCLRASYETRLSELSDLTGRFAQAFVNTLCQSFTDANTRTRMLANALGIEDINNDGAPERTNTCAGGAANVPCVAYSSSDGKPLAIQPDGFEWMSYGAFGRKSFRFDNRTFTYYARDAALAEPLFISYVTPTNREVRVCDFDTHIASAVLAGGAEVCAAIEEGDGRVERLHLSPSTSLKLTNERHDAQPRASGKVDIDNDGLEENVVELIVSSKAGRGCERNEFELLADDGSTLAENSNATAVRELQRVTPDSSERTECGIVQNTLLRFSDRIYLEMNATHSVDRPHELRLLQGTAVVTVCSFERQVRTRVRALY